MKVAQTRAPVKDSGDRVAGPRTASRFERELDDSPDAPPSRAQTEAWMRLLVGPDRPVAVWCKKSRQDDGTTRHVGGVYGPGDFRQMVKDARKQSGRAVGVHWGINPLKAEWVKRHAGNGLEPHVGPPGDADIDRLTMLPIDIDPRREGTVSATDEEKDQAEFVMQQVRRHLDRRGWPAPAVVDSGNGFYLLYRIDLPATDADVVKSVLDALKGQFSSRSVDIDTTVANPARVLKVPGTMACKGVSTRERPHRYSQVIEHPEDGLKAVPSDMLRKVAGEVENHEGRALPGSALAGSPAVVEAARRYIAKMPPAFSGDRGHSKTLAVASRIVVGFGIAHDSDAAWRLLQEYNRRCEPPWREKELRHKLVEADRLASEKGQARGGLLPGRGRADGVEQTWEPLDGTDFLCEVPDYGYCFSNARLPSARSKSGSHCLGLYLLRLWAAQRSDALIPDTLVRQTYWGGDHPSAWRRTLRNQLSKYTYLPDCRPDCPLHGTGGHHGHFVHDQHNRCGPLEEFVASPANEGHDDSDDSDDDDCEMAEVQDALSPPDGVPGARLYHFLSDEPHWAKKRAAAQKQGEVYLAYYPALVFGMSRRVGLTYSQVRLMMGITRELTRVGHEPTGRFTKRGKPEFKRSGSPRKDMAEVIRGGKVVNWRQADRKVVCGLLEPDQEYVAFAGNLKSHRGRGYRIHSDKHADWLAHAGYRPETVRSGLWSCVESLFDDLAVLADKFDLVPAGRHHANDEWRSLAEMRACLGSAHGREWLSGCTLRVFGPADYLVRWRYYFAKWLGFRWIPGGQECPFERAVPPNRGGQVCDGPSLRVWLAGRGWTMRQLADRLGLSRETVSRHVSGRRNSPEFWKCVRKVVRLTK